MLSKLIKDKKLDYIAMDLKGTEETYSKVTGVKVDLDKIKKSIKIIMESGVPYEFRTTVVPELIEPEDIPLMGEMIKGADKWFLQQFKSDMELVNKDFQNFKPYDKEVLEKMGETAKKYAHHSAVR